MPDLIAISQGLNALKAMTEILKTIAGARDSVKLLENTIELNQKILSVQTALADAQSEQTTLIQTIRRLEEKIANFQTWETEKQRYELKDLGWTAFAYMLKPNARGTEPPHWVCAHCYNERRISVIQHTKGGKNDRNGLFCPACHNEIQPSPSALRDAAAAPKWLD